MPRAEAHLRGRRSDERQAEGGEREGGVSDQEAHLEDVVPGLHIGYVDPLAVDVCIVRVIAAWAQALRTGQGRGEVLHTPQSHVSTPAAGPAFLCDLP